MDVMIAVADINTPWRRKPFEALSEWLPVLGLAPRDVFGTWQNRPQLNSRKLSGNYREDYITLLPGWASRFPSWKARRLWARANQIADSAGSELSAFVVTSPHYLQLVKKAKAHVSTFYYCSDDYAQYTGWGGSVMLQMEATVACAVTHSFFVSELLAERAVREYGVPAENVSVSSNATDEAFLETALPIQLLDLRARFPRLRSPLVGTIGGINERLDFDLLLECAAQREVGTLVMVGPQTDNLNDAGFQRLKDHPKCVFVGAQPHAELSKWMQLLDVALIPYRDTPLNRSCSPMRLFDHLAAGRPIIATDFCRQVINYRDVVQTAHTKFEFVQKLVALLQAGEAESAVAARREVARKNLWSTRAQVLATKIAQPKL